MRQLSSLNNLFFITIFLFTSCDDPPVITACSPNQQLDSCGNCYYSTNDPLWNDCVDPCEIANGQNVCDYENIVIDNCDCSGCMEFGDPNYCGDCLFSNPCECNYALYSHFRVDINPNCSNLNNCNSYEFVPDDIDFNIRERCGLLTNINSDYTINGLENINILDPCGKPINIRYYEDQDGNIADGCDMPINSIHILDNGDILYNSSDDIGDFQFSLENQCKNLASNICLTIPGCSWGDNSECIQNNINNIYGGDATRQGYSIQINNINSDFHIIGEYNENVIPYSTDYINNLEFINNDSFNSVYLRWSNVILSDNNYTEIPPNQNIIINHSNWCSGSVGGGIMIENDSLTTQVSPAVIEGFYYNGNDTVKFDDMYINLFFKSLNDFSVQPNECNQ